MLDLILGLALAVLVTFLLLLVSLWVIFRVRERKTSEVLQRHAEFAQRFDEMYPEYRDVKWGKP